MATFVIVEGATQEQIIASPLCTNPVRIVAFNTAEGWSRDVRMDIADELRRRLVEYDDVPASLQEFVETASRAR